jgi:hypothetical protein
MTMQYAVLPARSGRSYTGDVFTVASPDTVVTGNTITITERTNAKGLHLVSIVRESALPAGDYIIVLKQGTLGAAVGYFTFAGTDGETATETPATAVLDPASLRSALGMSAADLDSQMDAILAAASAGAGTGARTVTITVNDGTTVLQNAVVRFTEGANTFRALTNASGVATFNLDDATYTVAITKSGYTYAGTTLVVNGTETATYSMTATNVTSPTNPDLSAIEVLCLDDDFEAVAGVEVNFRMAAIASGDQNRAHPGAKKTVTSNSSGIARFEGPQGATIEWKRGTGQVWTAVTLDNDSVTNVTSVIGSP